MQRLVQPAAGRRPTRGPIPRLEHRLSRRHVLGGMGALGLAFLAGCGDDRPSGSSGPSGGAFPVTIEHARGSTTIESAPKRVITVGYSDQDVVLALGVVPVAVREWFGEKPYAAWPWATEALGSGKPTVLPSEELNFEQIAGLEPDLILGSYAGLTEGEYKNLSQIAPTVAQSADHADYTTPWQDMTLTIGRVLGKESQAKTLIADVEARFDDERAAHPEFEGATAAVIDGGIEPANFGLLGPDDPRGRIVRALGFQYPDGAAEQIPEDEFGADISRENFDVVDGDVLLVLQYAPDDRATMEADPLFQQLDVVKRGAVVYLDIDDPALTAAMGFSTVLSLPYLLASLVPRLTQAVATV